MKSVGSIGKITKAMKMVSASKMKGDLRRLENGRHFGCDAVDMIFKSDQEASLGVMLDRVATMVKGDVVRELSPVGESQSNGDIENAVQQIQGMYRTFKSNVETNYDTKVGAMPNA